MFIPFPAFPFWQKTNLITLKILWDPILVHVANAAWSQKEIIVQRQAHFN